MRTALPLRLVAIAPQLTAAANITRFWLTHKTNDPSKIVVNWKSAKPRDSVVRFGPTVDYREMVLDRREYERR